MPECDAYCSACFEADAYDDCHQLCVDGRDMYTNDSGVACGQAWLDWRACIATDPECDFRPDTEGPCRFYVRDLFAVCGGVVQGNCGRNPDGGAGEYDYCDGDPSNAGSCPDDVLYQNVGTDNCGSLPPFEGCCSLAGDYFYCDPMGDGGMTYEECPAP